MSVSEFHKNGMLTKFHKRLTALSGESWEHYHFYEWASVRVTKMIYKEELETLQWSNASKHRIASMREMTEYERDTLQQMAVERWIFYRTAAISEMEMKMYSRPRQ